MLFQSPVFLFWFLPAVMVAFWMTKGTRQKITLIVASYIFYGWWNPLFAPLLLISTGYNYVIGKSLDNAEGGTRKLWLTGGILINVLLLGFFKYENMLATGINAIAKTETVPLLSIGLPLGISFFTFEGISYLMDVYRRKCAPARNMVEFAYFLSFFPHLIAGPIIRFTDIRPQLDRLTQSWDEIAEGAYRLILGLSKKLLLADMLAQIAEPAFAAEQLSAGFAWMGLLAYSMQIYLDFSAYSDMAIGLGLLLGIRLPENFRQPYAAKSITEFWQRWHITLSQWIRDYLYIPLGGSRHGLPATVRNLLVTMMIAGLWHGADWSFVLWGAYYGVLLGMERIARAYSVRLIPEFLQRPTTFLLVTLGWVLFRAGSISKASLFYRALFPWTFPSGMIAGTAQWMTVILTVAYAFLLLERFIPTAPRRFGMFMTCVTTCLLLASVVMAVGSKASPFLYFQF